MEEIGVLTLEKKEKLIPLYLKGLSYTDIAKEIGRACQVKCVNYFKKIIGKVLNDLDIRLIIDLIF